MTHPWLLSETESEINSGSAAGGSRRSSRGQVFCCRFLARSKWQGEGERLMLSPGLQVEGGTER